jgi:hypothetical protein
MTTTITAKDTVIMLSCTHTGCDAAAVAFYVMPSQRLLLAYCSHHVPGCEAALPDHFDYTAVLTSSVDDVIDLMIAYVLGDSAVMTHRN